VLELQTDDIENKFNTYKELYLEVFADKQREIEEAEAAKEKEDEVVEEGEEGGEEELAKQATLVTVVTEEITPEEMKRREVRAEYKARIREYIEAREIELEAKKDKF